jgi:hypothetical protein
MSQNPYAPPEAEVDGIALPTPAAPAPALWNPNAAALWSLLLSPAFGAFLHMKNWAALGESGREDTSRKWFFGLIAGYLALSIASIWLPESRHVDALSRGGGVGLLVGWYFADARSQIEYVLRRHGKGYPRRGWLAALLLGLAGLVAFFVGAVALNLAIAAVLDLDAEGA